MTPPWPPPWDHCDVATPDPCSGARIGSHTKCLAHLAPADRATYLAGLVPGADINLCGTRITAALLGQLLAAVRLDGRPRLGEVDFSHADFPDGADFINVDFTGSNANFYLASFAGLACFNGSLFTRGVNFHDTTFSEAVFLGMIVNGTASFVGARFSGDARLESVTCRHVLALSTAKFEGPARIDAAAERVTCQQTRWDATASLTLRYADLDLTGAIITQPFAVSVSPFARPAETAWFSTRTPKVRVVSLAGTDTTHVLLTGMDLRSCRFAGAMHLDLLRLEGSTLFALPPTGVHWRRGVPRWWSQRRVLAEEHAWRALQQPPVNPDAPTTHEWQPGPRHTTHPARTPNPDVLAPLYRALRKGSEDAKNEPDAADFYYGEMEMRRNDPTRPRGEHILLILYWALSGYALRASRALFWLILAMTCSFFALILWGLPNADPKPQITGRQTAVGQDVQLTVDNPDPTLTTGYSDRITWKRAEKAQRVLLNSVIFRSSGQNLTTAGTYVEMGSRIAEPVLLGFALFALRGRIKR
ncbi:pentapeptide repeat-containing protein [Streptomyces sp. WI03-4A]|uniref:pentapeptide repeat-containing protein n=1 Tax=Streptomyces sp. WI03-4A TaxID=3028706 RepID=UPI0029B0C454|nr:pentapeptide repeat-containing protein [Streptomyces sp. WI03-4A]MDX2591965.1 pentapeptide repeat-containing protein [Streptomyces sp. WI03-4A]